MRTLLSVPLFPDKQIFSQVHLAEWDPKRSHDNLIPMPAPQGICTVLQTGEHSSEAAQHRLTTTEYWAKP